MPTIQSLTEVCSSCGSARSMEFINSVNTGTDPHIKEKIRSGELFTWTCPECGRTNLIRCPFLYHDPDGKIMILLSGSTVRSDVPDGYTGRLVRSAGELIEKINIFDSGLDDMVIELCKYITCNEMGKNVELRFLRTDGADAEMTFTYPENGEMQMIAVGFNVYEDCAGIIGRNPGIKESARGLAEVNPGWISGFFA